MLFWQYGAGVRANERSACAPHQAKTHRRLSPAELAELAGLQEAMLRYRQKVAPLPLENARQLHQDLLARAC
jgi:hypothetical protein